MKAFFYTFFILVIAYFTYRNVLMILSAKKNKKYVAGYEAMVRGKKETYETICDNVAKENNKINMARLLITKLNVELQEGRDYKDTLEKINIKDLIYHKGKLSQESISGYADSFLWMSCAIVNAYNADKKPAIEEILNIVGEDRANLQDRFEYKFEEFLGEMFTKKEHDTRFVELLRDGEFIKEYKYDKRFAPIYRSFGLAVLDKFGEELTEDEQTTLLDFAKTQLGEYILGLLGNKEKYAPTNKEDLPEVRLEALEAKKKKKKKKEDK